MAMITPTEGKKFERDPEEGNFPTGVYICELSRVEETGPGAKFPNGNNRLVFEFTVVDPQYPKYGGKRAIAFLGKTLHKSKDGRESNLVKWARMMGVQNPEQGFDPDALIGKKFQVTCEYTAGQNGQPGRAWARTAIISSGAPSHLNGNGAPIANHNTSFAGLDPNARWDAYDGTNTIKDQTTAQIQSLLAGGFPAKKLIVKPAGAAPTLGKLADQWGFIGSEVQNLEQIPW